MKKLLVALVLSFISIVVIYITNVLLDNLVNSKELTSADANSKKEYRENLCVDHEKVLLSFKLADTPKTLSVCISKTQPDYIVYRFGTKDKIELEFPENKVDSWSKFTYSYYLRGGGQGNEGMDLNYLTFENGRYEYQIYEEYIARDNMTYAGIKITDKQATNKVTEIKGLSHSVEGSLIILRDNKKIKIKGEQW
ncbi:MAG: hypothetical protein H0Z33_15865 [Bacillaceae bacterium]|nr:hypothetical protein [Bacillaceae bacterium]